MTVDPSGAIAAFVRARGLLDYGDRALGQGAQLIRRAAVAAAPKAEGTLHRNIQTERLAMLEHAVVARAAHSRFVEEGTGLKGPLRRWSGLRMLPDSAIAAIALWIKRKGIIARQVPQEELPWFIARKIARAGTPAQPYLAPAAQTEAPRVLDLVRAAIAQGVADLALGRA